MSVLFEPPVRAEYELAPQPREPQAPRPASARGSLWRGLATAGWLRKGLLLVLMASA